MLGLQGGPTEASSAPLPEPDSKMWMPVSQFSDNCRCKGDGVWLGWREARADELASPGEVLLMPVQSESHAPAAVNGTPQEPLPLPRTRLRHLGRITLVLASCLAPA